jgi:hypothetical protein
MKTCPNEACPDRLSLGVPGEYLDTVGTCPRCGARLVWATQTDAEDDAEPEDLGMVCVLESGDEALTTLVKSLLDGEGIPYVVKGEGVQDLLGWGRIVGGFNYAVGPAEILVHHDDADRARDLLQMEGVTLEAPPGEDDDTSAPGG